ncbi:chemotaxis-specific protein-glutamate methyltransferase CheB [Catalinimonas niigatensis]|uniref:chemotaxis-specific protein-glutamate methyltransferase CheB n=1 Tax=Catalinimonas niigatensis TaxID=1397264 RepID=UPI002665BFEE|nr:chemotaxis-specific protein-glutamate methyltransferase CheB [Catalinimonas niigatensis]WPP53119.1 chemotaxis-specific protein-glutamate methyltransferase CheB [Catalinimonas niigatensis]
MTSQKIKTVLIEDSGLMRILLSDILRSDPNIKLLSTAMNGKEGVEKVKQLKPDVVITDMVMPQFDGLHVVKQLMQHHQVPIILLSSLEKRDPKIFDALSAGAFEFINKEQVVALAKEGHFPLNELVKTASESKGSSLNSGKVRKNTNAHSFAKELPYQIIAIGASTGGPAAIETIIKQLPANLMIPVVIVQHMTEQFLPSFAQRLNKLSPLHIKLAERNETLEGGTIYIAPGHTNMKVVKNAITTKPIITFTSKTFKEFNFPSADCLLSSVAEVYRSKAIGVILTGMGKDGTEGLQEICRHGGYTIVQDESSSVVFGMPKSAIEAGAVKQVVKLHEIGGFLMSCLS